MKLLPLILLLSLLYFVHPLSPPSDTPLINKIILKSSLLKHLKTRAIDTRKYLASQTQPLPNDCIVDPHDFILTKTYEYNINTAKSTLTDLESKISSLQSELLSLCEKLAK